MFIAGLISLPCCILAQNNNQRVWCLKTDKGQYIEMSRVEMLAAVDGQTTFEVVVREGLGASDVKCITFEQYESDYAPQTISDAPPQVTATGPWCLITHQGDSIAMSLVEMLANVDSKRTFEIVTSDGANLVGINSVSFGRGQSNSSGNFAPIVNGNTPKALANPNNPWCLITSDNDTIAMSRIQTLTPADENGKITIITSDGDIRSGISYVRFAHGDTKTAGNFSVITSNTPQTLANPNNPWCLITEKRDTIAMSRVQMIANADANNSFEVVTNDGHNIVNVSYVRFAHGDTKTAGGFKDISSSNPTPVVTGTGPWCFVTESNDSVAVGRVSMLAHIDGNRLFEILTKYGDGLNGVQSIYITRGVHPLSGGFDPDYRDPVVIKGDADGNGIIEVNDIAEIVKHIMGIESDVFKFSEADFNDDGKVNVVDLVNVVHEVNKAQGKTRPMPLMTPVSQQLSLSALGMAEKAILFDMDGNEIRQYDVSNGATTIYVGDLVAGAYRVEIGEKSLLFIKK